MQRNRTKKKYMLICFIEANTLSTHIAIGSMTMNMIFSHMFMFEAQNDTAICRWLTNCRAHRLDDSPAAANTRTAHSRTH